MEPSPAQHESPAKDADKEVSSGSLSRFTTLAAKLFKVDPRALRDARTSDEEERRARRSAKSK